MNADIPALTMSGLLQASQPTDWRELDPANTLYVDLKRGRVVIELAPDFAPLHVENIRVLAREGYWNGLAVIRVNDNYVLQMADPKAEVPEERRPFGAAKAALPPEFDRSIDPALSFTKLTDRDVYAPSVGFSSGFPVARDEHEGRTWLVHTYGTVSAGRDTSIDSGNGSELTVVIGHAPRQLDRNVTVVGRVRYGMERLSSLQRGDEDLGFETTPEVMLKAVRLASEVPESERTQLEVLRTDTPLFLLLMEARKNRQEDWFHKSAGHIDIGNVPLPVRVVAKAVRGLVDKE